MSIPTPQDRYPAYRFLTDLRWVFAEAARLSVPERQCLVADYYRKTYPQDPHSVENQRRLLACADYLWRHLQEFSVEHWLHQHGDSCTMSPHLEGALYRLFAGCQLEYLGHDLPISKILDMAEEQQRLFPDGDTE
jgi:hypothetical protein